MISPEVRLLACAHLGAAASVVVPGIFFFGFRNGPGRPPFSSALRLAVCFQRPQAVEDSTS